MQDTHEEHAASSFASTSCQTCHMKERPEGRMSHRFAVADDPELLASSLRVMGVALEGERLSIAIAPGEVGHAVPTGDLHRRIEVRAWITGEGGRARPVTRLGLERHFAITKAARREVLDERIPAPGSRGGAELVVVPLVLDRAPTDREVVHWEIVWQRMTPAVASDLGLAPAQERTIMAGTIAP